MMLKTLFPTALLALCSLTTHAQRDARVQLQLGNWSSPNDRNGIGFNAVVINSAGISAEHRVYKNLFVKAGYQRWLTIPVLGTNIVDYYDKNAPDMANETSIGHIYERAKYNTIDVMAAYRLPLGRHELYAAAGVSTAFGVDYALKSYYFGGGFAEGGCEFEIDFNEIKAHHLGAAWEAGYNYNFAHQRLNIGTSISGQHYAADFNLYTVKLNLGYNFNIVRRK